jgi:hypothetical protein
MASGVSALAVNHAIVPPVIMATATASIKTIEIMFFFINNTLPIMVFRKGGN